MRDSKVKVKIVEGVEGLWYYHLSETGKNGKPALYGNKNVMNTGLPLNTRGFKGHLNERYCRECEKKYRKAKKY
jgi:hypothetical protein